jgi:hypothetical protein
VVRFHSPPPCATSLAARRPTLKSPLLAPRYLGYISVVEEPPTMELSGLWHIWKMFLPISWNTSGAFPIQPLPRPFSQRQASHFLPRPKTAEMQMAFNLGGNSCNIVDTAPTVLCCWCWPITLGRDLSLVRATPSLSTDCVSGSPSSCPTRSSLSGAMAVSMQTIPSRFPSRRIAVHPTHTR